MMTLKQMEMMREIVWHTKDMMRMIADKDELYFGKKELSKAYFALTDYAMCLNAQINAGRGSESEVDVHGG